MDDTDRAEVDRLLSGSYTAEGIRHWWRRPRPQLEGRTPEAAWASEPGRVVALARALTAERRAYWGFVIARGLKSLEEGRVATWDEETDRRIQDRIWIDEAERFRNQVVELPRERAKKKP